MINDLFKPRILLFFILYFSFLMFAASAIAQTMSNGSYIIKMGNLNSGAGKPTGPNYKVSFTLGQTGANLFSGPNYKVRAGFQYIYSIFTFRFQVTNITIDLGSIAPGSAVFRTSVLTVTNDSAGGYQVTLSQNHNLRVNATGAEIPATTCDSGPCTTSAAAPWTSALTYGFGYNCKNVSGTDCPTDFINSNYYRPFISSPSAAIVMSSLNVGKGRQATITYQVNISNTQTAGLYTNILNYIATPTF